MGITIPGKDGLYIETGSRWCTIYPSQTDCSHRTSGKFGHTHHMLMNLQNLNPGLLYVCFERIFAFKHRRQEIPETFIDFFALVSICLYFRRNTCCAKSFGLVGNPTPLYTETKTTRVRCLITKQQKHTYVFQKSKCQESWLSFTSGMNDLLKNIQEIKWKHAT